MLKNVFGDIALDATSQQIRDRLIQIIAVLGDSTSTPVANSVRAGLQAIVTELQNQHSVDVVDRANRLLGIVSLDAATLTALENITVTVSGEVEIKNDTGNPIPVSATTLPLPNGAATEQTLSAISNNIPDSGEREFLHITKTVTDAGDALIYAPSSPSKSIRLRWIYAINDPTASNSTLMKIRFGSSNEIYRVWAISKRQRKTGAPGESLFINLSAPGLVAVTAILEEV